MIYAQFFHRSATDPSKLVEACGDRGVIILDGRARRSDCMEWADEECRLRGYVAFQLMKGERFSDAIPIGALTFHS